MEVSLLTTTLCCKYHPRTTLRSTHSYVGVTVRRVVRFVGKIFSSKYLITLETTPNSRTGMFFFGAIVTSALCDVLRKNVGSLSPHFLSVCMPESHAQKQSSSEDVTQSVIINDLRRDVTYFSDDCSPWIGVKELNAARLQSPSYFVSMTSYCAVYTLVRHIYIILNATRECNTPSHCWYMRDKFNFRNSGLL